MAVLNAAVGPTKTVADPLAEYETLRPMWDRCRAVCGGERYAKDYDRVIDGINFRNLLIPFSPFMTPQQFNFYKAEAELPGIVFQFKKMLVGGLLRKQPTLEMPADAPPEAKDWIMNSFGQDDSSLVSFLDNATDEELITSRAWVYVDYPAIDTTTMPAEDRKKVKPYPILWEAEKVINWTVEVDAFGKSILKRLITKQLEESFDENEFHATLKDTVRVHELDQSGNYQIRVYQQAAPVAEAPVIAGQKLTVNKSGSPVFDLKDTLTNILDNGERLTFIPAWPLNGSIKPVEPVLTAIVDKEVSLYNKVSRRNHLLYGAATYTPILYTDMTDDDFQKVVNQGLGTWIKLRVGESADVLKTPTEALADMDRAIAAAIEEMAKLGIRMLTPETDQSGVALEIRNAAQTAQLGTLNTKISDTMAHVICFMVNWRYDKDYKPSDFKFQLSADFNPIPLGADWLRLATEWYQQGLLPRSVWLQMLKQNDMVPPDYDDEAGKVEIMADMEATQAKAQEAQAYSATLAQEGAPQPPPGKVK